jgi:hypothetical protein
METSGHVRWLHPPVGVVPGTYGAGNHRCTRDVSQPLASAGSSVKAVP